VSRPRIVLASASPRRRELLSAIGIAVEVSPMDVDERVLEGEAAMDYVVRVAEAKRDLALSQTHEDIVVIAGDTSVVRDGVVLGKPANDAHATEMLVSLLGRVHEVMTAVAVGRGDMREHTLVVTEVDMRSATSDEIARYVRTGEGRDKAGGYAIQGIGAGFVRGIRGSYGAVVGLPQVETLALLRAVGALAAWP
jgi:septum formation protein